MFTKEEIFSYSYSQIADEIVYSSICNDHTYQLLKGNTCIQPDILPPNKISNFWWKVFYKEKELFKYQSWNSLKKNYRIRLNDGLEIRFNIHDRNEIFDNTYLLDYVKVKAKIALYIFSYIHDFIRFQYMPKSHFFFCHIHQLHIYDYQQYYENSDDEFNIFIEMYENFSDNNKVNVFFDNIKVINSNQKNKN